MLSQFDNPEVYGRLRATLTGRQLVVDEFTLHGGPGSKVRIPGRSGNLSTAASEAAADGGQLSLRGTANWGEPAAPGGSGIRMDMQGQIRALRVLVRSDRQVTLSGDLQGTARWLLRPDGDRTDLVYLQDVLVTGRLLGALSVALRRPLAWNHDKMMAGCREGLAAYV